MNVFDLTAIEKELQEAVRATGASGTVYTSRPNAVPGTMDDFIVAKVSGQVTDRGAIGSCICSVSLFAKDLQGGFKNGTRLSLMQRRLTEGLALSTGSLMFSDTPRIVADAPDGYGYTARIINIDTTIKTTNLKTE